MRQQLCASACALMVLLMGCATDSLSWQRYTENDFPARVRSVTTSLGYVLDAERGVNYRQWTVSIGKGIPYAFSTDLSPEQGLRNHCQESKVRSLFR